MVTRNVSYIEGQDVMISDSLGLEVTSPLLWGEELAHFRTERLRPPPDCAWHENEKPVRFVEISGQRVAEFFSGPRPSPWNRANTTWVTEFRAVDLACEKVGYLVVEQSHVDGSRKLMTKARLVNLTVGPPDPKVFDVPPTLKEVSLQEFQKDLRREAGLAPEKCD